jgi:hypothetical protein
MQVSAFPWLLIYPLQFFYAGQNQSYISFRFQNRIHTPSFGLKVISGCGTTSCPGSSAKSYRRAISAITNSATLRVG